MEEVAKTVDEETKKATRLLQREAAEDVFAYFSNLVQARAKVVSGRFSDKEQADASGELLKEIARIGEKYANKISQDLAFLELFFMCVDVQDVINWLDRVGLNSAASLQAQSLGMMEGALAKVIESILGKKIDTSALELALNSSVIRPQDDAPRVILATR